MLSDTLRGLGHAPSLVEDGDPSALEADLLLLTGNSTAWTRYPSLLAGAGRRPRTVLWHLEPLPPPDLPAQAEEAGLALARCDLSSLPEPWRAIAKNVPFHNGVRDLIRWVRAAPLKRQLAGVGAHEVVGLRSYELARVMREYAWFRQSYSAAWCDQVFTGTQARSQFLASRGICARCLPMGHHPTWGRDLGLDRDIDVLFIGRVDRTSRHGPFRALRRALASRGVHLTAVTRGCYGEHRTRLLNRARIALDLVRLPWEMPVMRPLMSMGCGALVVSDWTGDPAPFAREHLVQARGPDLADAIFHYLDHEEDRRRVAEAARRFATEELTLAGSVAAMLR